MAKATESASLSVEPQRRKPRSWLRVPRPCLIAWLRIVAGAFDLKRPDVHPLARQTSPHRRSLGGKRGRETVPCQDRSRRRRWPKASLYKGLSPGHARTPRAPFGCIAWVSCCKTTIRQVALFSLLDDCPIWPV